MAAKLFVGNLSFQATEEDLRELFQQAGTVETVRIITDQFTGRPRGFGFVEMTTKEEASKAVEMLNGRLFRDRNLVITGDPQIPDELDLLASGDLKGWLLDYYGNAPGQSPVQWIFLDGMLLSEQTVIRNAVAGRLKVQDIIRYHRPMLEDGEISYEFFYDPATKVPVPQDNQRPYFFGGGQPQQFLPGQAIVHPALDRMVCLLEPDGVKIHWLTDGRFDRTGLAPGNVSPPSDQVQAQLPLKKRDWNAIKFATKGDTLTIELNGQSVFSHAIEPTNLRHFGLFRYANESSVRVRNIRYRGDWPKTLPAGTCSARSSTAWSFPGRRYQRSCARTMSAPTAPATPCSSPSAVSARRWRRRSRPSMKCIGAASKSAIASSRTSTSAPARTARSSCCSWMKRR